MKVESRIRRGKDDGWGDMGGGFDDKEERCYMSIFEEIKGDWVSRLSSVVGRKGGQRRRDRVVSCSAR